MDFKYDEYGNLILETNGSSTKTYSCDLNNRLSEVVEGPQTLQFTYDGSGHRLMKSINEVEVEYVNDTTIENEQVLSYTVETDVTNIVYGLNRLNEDGVGYLSDSYGNIIQHGSESYAYTPYGELTQGLINGVNEAGYKGEVHDTLTLQYLRTRTYNTQLKQFLQEDTYVGKDSHPLSQNRYAFVLNNPFKYSDPSGHYAIPVMMEDNFRSTPVKPLKVSSSLTRNLSKEISSQKAEIEQIQTIHKSTQEVIQKNKSKNDENLSKMNESTRKVVEEQIKNRDLLIKAAKSKEDNLNREIKQKQIDSEKNNSNISDSSEKYGISIQNTSSNNSNNDKNSLNNQSFSTYNSEKYGINIQNHSTNYNEKYGINTQAYQNNKNNELKINEKDFDTFIDSTLSNATSYLVENAIKFAGKIPGSLTFALSFNSQKAGNIIESVSNSNFVKSPAFGPIVGATVGTVYDIMVNGEDVDNAIAGNIVKTTLTVGASQGLLAGLTLLGVTSTAGIVLPFLVAFAVGVGIDNLYENNFLGIKDTTQQVVDSIGNYFNDRNNFEADFLNFKEQMNLDHYSKGNY